MPLRDHFRPPLDNITSWEGLFGGWPAVIVQHLHTVLPSDHVAAPRIDLGSRASSTPTYEVKLFDAKRGRRLVAAIELVSPANKDRPEHRQAFVAKCAALLQQHVSVTIVDLVTVRQANLYAELLDFLGESDPTVGNEPPSLYSVACRWGTPQSARTLRAWHHPMTIGEPLPTLPLWLEDRLVIALDLEESYEKTCKDLWIS